MKFLPDQIEVLQEILDDPAIVAAAATGTNPALIASFVEKVRGFVANNIAKFKTSRLGFQLVTPSGTAGTKLTVSAALTSALSSVMFSVDETLNVHEEKAAQLTVPASCSRTKQANSIEMICYGAQFFVIVSGQVIAEGNVVDSDVPPVPNMWLKPMSRFSDILADHVEEDIKNEKRVRYWYDKEKRILLVGPDGTEKIFHHDLMWWLKNLVSDRLRVYGETRGLGQDATDITVVTPGGSYVIEVKWMGKNENGQSYKKVRINQGLEQLKQYLENDAELVGGYLVVYDARSSAEHKSESGFDDTLRHVACAEPEILFLENETPSTIAKKIKA